MIFIRGRVKRNGYLNLEIPIKRNGKVVIYFVRYFLTPIESNESPSSLSRTVLYALTCSCASISCQELFNYVVEQYDRKSYTTCYGSTMLTKVDYYVVDGNGFVVGYIKQNEWDYKGQPYLFCGISNYTWSQFKMNGMTGSWGKAFHDYIMDYTCNCY